MMTFRYSAYASDGGQVRGTLEAADRVEAIRQLGAKRLQPIDLQAEAAKGRTAVKPVVAAKGPVVLKGEQVMLFVEELGDLMKGGIQLEPALSIMGRRKELSGIKEVASRIRDRLRDGESFAQALRHSSPSFGEMFCNLVAAGEHSGSLPEVLLRQAKYLASLQALRNRVLFALIYPGFLVGSAVAVLILFVSFLIPKLTELLDSTGGALPLGAELIMGLTQLAARSWWVVLLLAGGVGIWLSYWVRQGENREIWDRWKLRWPLLGRVFLDRFYVQFLETLSNILANGLPLKSALDLTRRATDNLHLQRKLAGVIAEVADGANLSEALARTGEFPTLLLDMIVVGEEVGDLPAALRRAGERYDKELTRRTEKLGALVQPAVIVLMASLVGALAYLMITAIFQTISGIG